MLLLLFFQVFGCQKCYANCKNNSRCFGNITKRLASIEKARGNTFKLHCDTSTHQRLHYADRAESSSDSEMEDQEAIQGEVINLTGKREGEFTLLNPRLKGFFFLLSNISLQVVM